MVTVKHVWSSGRRDTVAESYDPALIEHCQLVAQVLARQSVSSKYCSLEVAPMFGIESGAFWEVMGSDKRLSCEVARGCWAIPLPCDHS